MKVSVSGRKLCVHFVTLILPSLTAASQGQSSERRRLDSLRALEVLDTAAEERFDRCTRLLRSILQVPAAVVSLSDENRQWFKSASGLDATETPRDLSFCSYAIEHEEDLFVVQDATKHPDFSQNPFVVGEPGIRFYAGAVIRSPEGHPIGTCCVMDWSPRILRDHERLLLEQVARLIEYELQIGRETKSLTKRLQESAYRDESTGLPNSVLFTHRLHQLCAIAKEKKYSFMVALVQINRCDALVAALGREAPNHVIRLLVERIDSSLPKSATIGRKREDQLAIVVPIFKNASPNSLLQSILASIEQPLLLDDHSIHLQVSIGASLFPKHADNADSLLKRARTALWSIRSTAASSVQIYTPGQSKNAQQSFQLETALERALARDELNLQYQPKVDLASGKIIGAEALMRWTSEELGVVSPAIFIPIAESSGLIHELSDWLTDTVCAQIAQWRTELQGCPQVSINVTSSVLRERRFIGSVSDRLSKYGVPGDLLEFELTESTLVDDIEGAVQIMNSVQDKLGVTWAIDDFGTGFSSLAYLRRMPVKLLKIDRTFISSIPDNAEDMKLTQSIVSLGHSLGLKVLAEGVETPEQMAFLRRAHCDYAQGYFFSRPLDERAYRALFSSGQSLSIEPNPGKRQSN